MYVCASRQYSYIIPTVNYLLIYPYQYKILNQLPIKLPIKSITNFKFGCRSTCFSRGLPKPRIQFWWKHTGRVCQHLTASLRPTSTNVAPSSYDHLKRWKEHFDQKRNVYNLKWMTRQLLSVHSHFNGQLFLFSSCDYKSKLFYQFRKFQSFVWDRTSDLFRGMAANRVGLSTGFFDGA